MSQSLQAQIAEQAYLMWIKDGMAHGRAEQHWAAAERLLSQQAAKPADATPKPAVKAAASKAALKRGRAPIAKGRSR